MIAERSISDVLNYDPDTGLFTWKSTIGRRAKSGQIAGTIDREGYVRIMYLRKRYGAHRIAFLIMTGAWPPAVVDHINLDRADNRWCNLRCATVEENSRNRPAVGEHPKGVCFNKASGKFQAGIKVSGKSIYLGLHDTAEDANAAYAAAAIKYFGNFARTS